MPPPDTDLRPGSRAFSTGVARAFVAIVVLLALSAFAPASAPAAPAFRGLVIEKEREIAPRTSVAARILCPRGQAPLTWGFSPADEAPAGVSVAALLSAAEAVSNKSGNRAGFRIALANPNLSASVRMLYSLTCVEGKRGVRASFAPRAFNARASATDGGASAAGVRDRGTKPGLKVVSSGVQTVPVEAGIRVETEIRCPGSKGMAVGANGIVIDLNGLELVGIEGLDDNGKPGVRVVIQNRLTVSSVAGLAVHCIRGQGGLRVRQAFLDEGDPSPKISGNQPGLKIEHTRVERQFEEAQRFGRLTRCGKAIELPLVRAFSLGPWGLVGARTGTAAEQFIDGLESFFFGKPPGSATGSGFASLASLQAGPFAVILEAICIKALGRLVLRVHPDSEIAKAFQPK